MENCVNEIWKLYGIEVLDENKFYLMIDPSQEYRASFNHLLIDGNPPEFSFSPQWVKLEKKPTKMEKKQFQPSINQRFELKDSSLQSDRIPLVLKVDDVLFEEDLSRRNFFESWVEEYRHLRSLYSLKEDAQEPQLIPIKFEFVEIFKVRQLVENEKFEFDVLCNRRWIHQGERKISKNDVTYKLIERIFYPEILLPQRPCEFDSQTVYDITRQFIKQNINPKVARITSDYAFCFEVKKRIPLVEPITTSINNGTTKRPKYTNRVQKEKLESCFKMTSAVEKYQGYPIIDAITAKNQKELHKKMDSFLKEVMDFINEPIKECDCCKGRGIVNDKNWEMRSER